MIKQFFHSLAAFMLLLTSFTLAHGANINVHPLSFPAVKAYQQEIQKVVQETPVAFIKKHPELSSYHFQQNPLGQKGWGENGIYSKLAKIYSDAAFGKGELANRFAQYYAVEFYGVHFDYYYLKYINDKILAVFFNDKSPEMEKVRAENATYLEKQKKYASHIDLMKLAVEKRKEHRKLASAKDS